MNVLGHIQGRLVAGLPPGGHHPYIRTTTLTFTLHSLSLSHNGLSNTTQALINWTTSTPPSIAEWRSLWRNSWAPPSVVYHYILDVWARFCGLFITPSSPGCLYWKFLRFGGYGLRSSFIHCSLLVRTSHFFVVDFSYCAPAVVALSITTSIVVPPVMLTVLGAFSFR